MADNSFSSGFGSGGSVAIGGERNRLFQQQQAFEQRKVLRAEVDKGVTDALTRLQDAAKSQSTAFFSETEETGKQNIKDLHTKTAQTLWGSTQQMLEVAKQNGLYNDAEIANIKEQFKIGATLNNPAAEKKLIAAGEAEGKLPAQQALESQKQDTVQKQFVNDLGETVTQTKDGQFIDTQGAVITDTTKLNNLKTIPTTQNVNTTTLAPKVVGNLQTDVVSNENRIARLTNIRSQINSNPEFLQLPTKLAAAATNMADKLGIPVPDAAEKLLAEQTKFVRDAIENINLYIKEITGAQMSEKEADRLKLAQPDPGQDVFSGDGPIKFKAKADSAIESAAMAQARSIYFLENGITHDFKSEQDPPVSLEGMKQIVNDKGREQAIIIRAQNPNMPKEEVIRRAGEAVQKKYGLSQ